MSPHQPPPPSSRPTAASRAQGSSGNWWEEEAEISDAPGFSGSRTRPFQEPLLPLPAVSVLGSRSERWAHGLQEEEAKVWTKGS